jgi:molecular chaperone HtpG
MAKRGAYRGGGADAQRAAPSEGLVDDIVRQFADPYAFFRELVQNAIDAGATKITVRLVHDETEQVARISVEDDGSGMSAEVLQGDLTVLFKSTKENRDDAIGKFGIGFVSVLALGPTLVAVDTSVGDGVRHRLELHQDHTYDLLRAEGKGRGTTVTLHVPTTTDELDERIGRSRASLSKWCLHARVPIILLIHTTGSQAAPERIDRPLDLAGALIEVKGVSRDGRTEVVVGLGAAPVARGAFYNRGLLLHESEDVFPGIGAVWFKVADGRLEHTLSRDDVRRDAHFASALERVARTVHGPLLEAVHAHLASAGLPRWRVAFDAALHAGLQLHRDLHVPLLTPIGGMASWPLSRFDALMTGPLEPAFAEALAERGIGVLALEPMHDGARLTELGRIAGTPSVLAARTYAVIDPAIAEAEATALETLVEPLTALLANVARKPSGIAFARFDGGAAGTIALGIARPDSRVVVPVSELHADPFRLLARPPLLVHVGHPVMGAAVRALGRAVDAGTVAALVARAILDERALLDADRRAMLLRVGLERALKGARS